MGIYTELKNIIGYTGTDLDILFILFSFILLLYLINVVFGLMGNIFKWK